MTKSLKILFVSLEGVGHVNACVGIAEVLEESGHHIIFALNEQWIGRLTKYGFEEVLLSEEGMKVGDDPAKHLAEMVKKSGGFKSGTTPLEKQTGKFRSLAIFLKKSKDSDIKLEPILKAVRPDVIVLDQFFTLTSVLKSGIPWVLVCSANPLMYMDDERTPPAGSGLPSNGNKNEWKEYRNICNEAKKDLLREANEYLKAQGVPELKNDKSLFINDSPYLNIYGFPLELDYLDIRPLSPHWYQFDNLKRTEKQLDFELPEKLRGMPGKLIYFSMGSMGSANISMMKRLIGILGKSKHRFIVSKGPLHSEYSLADNMWGQQSVPQIQVLPLVDLVIAHGGNNTVTETFFFGKPMIVMPLFGDQADNAQRVQEKGFGLRLDPNLCTETELLNGIEKLLNDKKMNEKLSKISERIQTENSIGKLPKMIENIVNNKK